MIVITGAAGFIGSNLVAALNSSGYYDLILVDDFTSANKKDNLKGKRFTGQVHRDDFHHWLDTNHERVQLIFHIGARTDTAEFDWEIFEKLNVRFSKEVWKRCHACQIPLIFASSAATYGDGSKGYSDNHAFIHGLEPLNPYGRSKQVFDEWILKQKERPFFWAGFKFFNVYGPNEYHKGRMASVIFHTFNQVREHGYVNLFRSHRNDFKDGEQKRDFIYVKDLCKVLIYFMEERKHSGYYNLGTGTARTFNDLAKATFRAMDLPVDIRYIDIPKDIRDKYQYYTRAEMNKLRQAGCNYCFTALEKGIEDYVKNYLMPGQWA